MKRRTLLATLCTFAALCSSSVATQEDTEIPWGKDRATAILQVDVVENVKRFVFDETPLDTEGKPAYGNEFVTEGFIYPHGFLDDKDGVDEQGRPTHPEEVIGRWTCRGWHVGKGAATQKGPWVITHQLYNFSKRPGEETLATDGLERVDTVPIKRAVVGGTGRYRAARGESTQVMLGLTATGGVKLRVDFALDNGN